MDNLRAAIQFPGRNADIVSRKRETADFRKCICHGVRSFEKFVHSYTEKEKRCQVSYKKALDIFRTFGLCFYQLFY